MGGVFQKQQLLAAACTCARHDMNYCLPINAFQIDFKRATGSIQTFAFSVHAVLTYGLRATHAALTCHRASASPACVAARSSALIQCRPSEFALHVAAKGAIGVGRHHHVRSCIVEGHSGTSLTLSPQVFVNRDAQSAPPARASASHSHAATRADHPPTLITAPIGPFGIRVSDTQSTTSSSAATPRSASHRGGGNIGQLQLPDDRYRSSTDGITCPLHTCAPSFLPAIIHRLTDAPRAPSPAATMLRRRQLQAAAEGAPRSHQRCPLFSFNAFARVSCVLLIFLPDRPRACQEVSVVHGRSVQNGRHRSGLDAPPRPMTYSQLEYRYIIANLRSLHLQQCHYTAKRVLHAEAP
jgi:hypothetical protein